MEEDTLFADDPGDFIDGREDAGLVVCPHDGDDGGIGANGFLEGAEIDLAGGIHREPCDLDAAFGKGLAVFHDGAVLDGGGDDVLAVAVQHQSGVDGGVGGFGAATGEDDFARLAAEQRGDAFAGFVHRFGDLRAEAVRAGGVAVEFGEERHHLGNHGGIDLGGRVIVEIREMLLFCGHKGFHFNAVRGIFNTALGGARIPTFGGFELMKP